MKTIYIDCEDFNSLTTAEKTAVSNAKNVIDATGTLVATIGRRPDDH